MGRRFAARSRTQYQYLGPALSGLDHELKVGDVIGVEYGDRKSRCRVVWVMDGGPIQKIQVGVQIVTDQDCPWKSELMKRTKLRAARAEQPPALCESPHFVSP